MSLHEGLFVTSRLFTHNKGGSLVFQPAAKLKLLPGLYHL